MLADLRAIIRQAIPKITYGVSTRVHAGLSATDSTSATRMCFPPSRTSVFGAGPEGMLFPTSVRLWKSPYLSEDGEALSHSMVSFESNVVSPGNAKISRLLEPAADAVWLAAYTTPRHEKTVARHLDVRGIEFFLPLYKASRKWKNGCKVEVELPIFPNYVFVRTATNPIRESTGFAGRRGIRWFGKDACVHSR